MVQFLVAFYNSSPCMVSVKKILVADDEKSLAKALQLKLMRAGFEVEIVFDGEDAIQAAKSEKFDLILLDLVMPKKDGFQVLEECEKIHSKSKIIVISNLGQTDDAKKAKEMGAINFFIKSDTPLLEIIDYIKSVV